MSAKVTASIWTFTSVIMWINVLGHRTWWLVAALCTLTTALCWASVLEQRFKKSS